jgi:cystathionine beta-lyase
VHRASTIRYPDAAAFASRFERDADGYVYGLYGTPTHRYLEKKISELEGGARTVLTPSGQAAISMAMLSLLRSGDRVLIPDTIYGPVRDLAGNELVALGIDVVFYDPCDLKKLELAIIESTRLIWVESPGSITMEIQDIPAIVRMAHAAGALVGCDNTWASPLYFKPLTHGVDLVVEALSKHFSGHSDVLMGSITTADEQLGLKLKASLGRLGIGTSPDDCALVARGIETLAVRLARASQSALEIAQWLSRHPVVDSVLYPALPGASGHDLWKRDFTGACGVFSFTLRADVASSVFAALDALNLIAIGASWGGTKSLIAPTAVRSLRTAKPWSGSEHVLRLNVGLEDVSDIRDDLERFLDALQPTATADTPMQLTVSR